MLEILEKRGSRQEVPHEARSITVRPPFEFDGFHSAVSPVSLERLKYAGRTASVRNQFAGLYFTGHDGVLSASLGTAGLRGASRYGWLNVPGRGRRDRRNVG
ncbi:MAG: hypothetical protein ACT4QC_21705, partial [Planctomycetaceae bacterium]